MLKEQDLLEKHNPDPLHSVVSLNSVNFSIPLDAQHSNISIILEPITAGSTTEQETCMINLAAFFALLKSNGFIERKKPSFSVCTVGPKPSPRGGNSSDSSWGRWIGLPNPPELERFSLGESGKLSQLTSTRLSSIPSMSRKSFATDSATSSKLSDFALLFAL
nr:hypothetical protein DEO72_LG10g2500 [Ipomoea batatas]